MEKGPPETYGWGWNGQKLDFQLTLEKDERTSLFNRILKNQKSFCRFLNQESISFKPGRYANGSEAGVTTNGRASEWLSHTD